VTDVEPEHFLAVDIGNTTVVIGYFVADVLDARWRLSSFVGRTGDEILLTFEQLLTDRLDALRHGGRAGIASVVPDLTRPFADACVRLFDREPTIVSAENASGIPIRYVDPAQIGPDRIANVAAVRAAYRTPAIVVDLGTTTNFDVIGADGAFEGGVIAPGFFSSSEALFRRAARLPRVELTRPPRAIGRSTEEAIRSGVVFGTVGQIDEIVRRITAELGGDPLVIATGGHAESVTRESATIQEVVPDLTLEGIRLLSRG
jgi:type III pantothenate kinase